MIPISAVLADKEVMLCIRPGEHGRCAAMKFHFVVIFFLVWLFLHGIAYVCPYVCLTMDSVTNHPLTDMNL